MGWLSMSSSIMMNDKPVFFFRARSGEGDTVHYALYPIQNKQGLAEAKFWGTRLEGKRAIVYVDADFVDMDHVKQLVKRGLVESGSVSYDQ